MLLSGQKGEKKTKIISIYFLPISRQDKTDGGISTCLVVPEKRWILPRLKLSRLLRAFPRKYFRAVKKKKIIKCGPHLEISKFCCKTSPIFLNILTLHISQEEKWVNQDIFPSLSSPKFIFFPRVLPPFSPLLFHLTRLSYHMIMWRYVSYLEDGSRCVNTFTKKRTFSIAHFSPLINWMNRYIIFWANVLSTWLDTLSWI